jgi:hypothetical protein
MPLAAQRIWEISSTETASHRKDLRERRCDRTSSKDLLPSISGTGSVYVSGSISSEIIPYYYPLIQNRQPMILPNLPYSADSYTHYSSAIHHYKLMSLDWFWMIC